MNVARTLVALAFVIVLGIPLGVRLSMPKEATVEADRKLVIITPHVTQIRREFGAAFNRWHHEAYGEYVEIDFRHPGGTSEILRQLQGQYQSAVDQGLLTIDANGEIVVQDGALDVPDLMFGGGSYDHGRLKQGDGVRAVTSDGTLENIPMSVPAGFSQDELDELFGENSIGAGELYDPAQYWIGTALSSFGIVFNRDVLKRLMIPEPGSFDDLTDPRFRGWIALADPRQSGSITTTFDSILNHYDWDEGWRILREMTANTRYFTNSSTKPPIDVSQGEAAAGLAIDFYGRTQAQSVMQEGQTPETARVGYADPPAVFIDADPISILLGAREPELARRFLKFCLSEQGQALWQFEAQSEMGPREFELRRMPVRRIMYEKYLDQFVDKVDPFEVAMTAQSRGWRSSIGVMMGAFAIDTAEFQREAWDAIARAEAFDGFPPERLANMQAKFLSWPTTLIDQVNLHPAFASLSEEARAWVIESSRHDLRFQTVRSLVTDSDEVPSDSVRAELLELLDMGPERLEFTPDTYRTVRNYWRDPRGFALSRIAYTEYFRKTYREIVALAEPHL